MKLTDKIEITNEDNMLLMARYPDGYFDLAIVDPPYGIGFEDGGQYFKKKNKSSKKNWDKEIPNDNYFAELFRVSKNQIIWGGNYFDLPPTRCVLAWTKTAEVQDRTFSEWEMAWTSYQSIAKYYNLKPFLRNGIRIHPTQKPTELYKWILDNYAKTNDKILDTHLGSGSIAIACADYGFELTACELDKEYYDKAIQRIQNHLLQQKLF
jgi:site-specific DNA-methyltransferase (adenine-specific)